MTDRSESPGQSVTHSDGEADDTTAVGEETTTTPDGPDTDLPLDLVFTVLKNQRRRHVLAYLREEGGPVSLSDLSEYVAAKENDKTPAELRSQERKRAYVGLYQCHLPMMDDAGVVDFNKDRGFVDLEDRASTFDSYLEKPTAPSTPWHAYYLALALLGGVAVAVSLAVPAFPAALVGGVQAAVVGCLALLHGWRGGASIEGRTTHS